MNDYKPCAKRSIVKSCKPPLRFFTSARSNDAANIAILHTAELPCSQDSTRMSAANKLLIIDDDHELCELLIDYLGSAGFDIDAVNNPEEGIRRALNGQYALAIL